MSIPADAACRFHSSPITAHHGRRGSTLLADLVDDDVVPRHTYSHVHPYIVDLDAARPVPAHLENVGTLAHHQPALRSRWFSPQHARLYVSTPLSHDHS
ncbi:hypothetical protein EVG20_g10039 [Dentipellis fragilis]|uniref:Uncharacterized protein n=1 Tax=Dentipellis fragilis TaxID=205917 RepID=A0A4Y9XTZ4_9AGAM|nr:hypothetical protein EVG20_g10039 [Dentipellis fragilis]